MDRGLGPLCLLPCPGGRGCRLPEGGEGALVPWPATPRPGLTRGGAPLAPGTEGAAAGPGCTSHLSLAQVVVVQAISALCQKYPRKHAVLMNFLFSMLREEVRVGGPGSTC